MSFFKEFKAFVTRGEAVDLAIGVIIGVALGKVVGSIVSDILMPPIGLLLGGADFSDFGWMLKAAENGKPAVIIKYGIFINTVINFIIVALVVFLIIKAVNKLRGAGATQKDCPQCLMLIPIAAKKCGHCCSEQKYESKAND
ncbi:MAG TPA: large-conductance mechanosensitive channel protein MscL [Myxococcota bacterium]|nr:large-conductance mechanosensitive channel protein MscL [Myxococcota bacterium]